MPLPNYTTSIAPTKTVMEIQAALAKAGASAIMANYDTNGNIVALSFRILADGQEIAFKLPTAGEPVQKTLVKQRVSLGYETPEHALRVAWRIPRIGSKDSSQSSRPRWWPPRRCSSPTR